MVTALSILGLLALWAILAVIETLPWPPQNSGLYSHDPDYLRAVQRDTAAYLATHRNVSDTVRSTVTAMAQAAQQRLGGVSR